METKNHLLSDLKFKLEKQQVKIELLEAELQSVCDALLEKDKLSKALELDLEHALSELSRLCRHQAYLQ